MSCSSKNPRLKITRAIVDHKYNEWIYDEFKDFCFNKSGLTTCHRYDPRYETNYEYSKILTRACPAFKEHYKRFYPPNSIKRVPRDLVLTPLLLAVWFADDGHSAEENTSMRMKISTEGFLKEDTEFLATELTKRYNENFYTYPKEEEKGQWLVKTTTRGCIKLFNEIDPYMREFHMERKITWDKNKFFISKIPSERGYDKFNPSCDERNFLNNILKLKSFTLNTLFNKNLKGDKIKIESMGVRLKNMANKGLLTKSRILIPYVQGHCYEYSLTELGIKELTNQLNNLD